MSASQTLHTEQASIRLDLSAHRPLINRADLYHPQEFSLAQSGQTGILLSSVMGLRPRVYRELSFLVGRREL